MKLPRNDRFQRDSLLSKRTGWRPEEKNGTQVPQQEPGQAAALQSSHQFLTSIVAGLYPRVKCFLREAEPPHPVGRSIRSLARAIKAGPSQEPGPSAALKFEGGRGRANWW